MTADPQKPPRKRATERPLTERERRFVETFAASGNATHAARVAGYTGSDAALAKRGSDLVRKPEVAASIAEIGRKRTRASVATRDRRLEVLTQLVEGELLAPIGIANGKPVFGPPSHDARRKAAMDIARMNGELIEKHDVVVDVSARSVHVVLTVPPSPHAPPSAAPALDASTTTASDDDDQGGDDGGR